MAVSVAAFVFLAVCILAAGCAANPKYGYREDGIAHLQGGDYEQAIVDFDRAISASESIPGQFETDVLCYRAEAEYLAGDYDAAVHTYEILMQIDREKQEYLLKAAIALAKKCQGNVAAGGVAAPGSDAAAGSLSAAGAKAGVSADTDTDTDTDTDSKEEPGGALSVGGSVLADNTASVKKALEYYHKAYLQAPGLAQGDGDVELIRTALYRLGSVLEAERLSQDAVLLYDQAIDTGFATGEAYNRKGLILMGDGRYGEARMAFEDGIAFVESELAQGGGGAGADTGTQVSGTAPLGASGAGVAAGGGPGEVTESEILENMRYNLAADYVYMRDYETALRLYGEYLEEYGSDPKVEKELAFLLTR
ncbi:MAG: tetratricopeptide repeat protein [Lachnospiraceae bacterium]|jgi:tetratricopeptide (TPR) repeat protein|nr:tetratricopeptide repeat protein [Lachnospiraceae bacterium]